VTLKVCSKSIDQNFGSNPLRPSRPSVQILSVISRTRATIVTEEIIHRRSLSSQRADREKSLSITRAPLLALAKLRFTPSGRTVRPQTLRDLCAFDHNVVVRTSCNITCRTASQICGSVTLERQSSFVDTSPERRGTFKKYPILDLSVLARVSRLRKKR
jgi:hypothetical protein